MKSWRPDPSATLSRERRARLYGYLARVLVAGDSPPEIDADTAATLGGLALGWKTQLVMRVRGIPPEEATAVTTRWVRDQALIAAAHGEGSDAAGPERSS